MTTLQRRPPFSMQLAICLGVAACSRAERNDNIAPPAASPSASEVVHAAPSSAPKPTTDAHLWHDVGQNIEGPWGPPRDYRAIARGNDLFVVVDALGEVRTSPTGEKWTKVDIGAKGSLSVAAYAEGKYFAAGSGSIFSSADGKTWTKGNAPGPVVDIASIPGTIVLASRGASFTSKDGTAWARHAVKDFEPVQVVGGDGRFVAVGVTKTDVFAFVSADGVKWSAHPVPGAKGETPPCLAWAMNAFWMVSASGHVFRSADGMSWSEVAQVRLTEYPAIALAHGSGMLLLVAGREQGGCVYASEDGLTWTWQACMWPKPAGIAFGHGVFVMPLEKNKILSTSAF
jgi:hypothetical protein